MFVSTRRLFLTHTLNPPKKTWVQCYIRGYTEEGNRAGQSRTKNKMNTLINVKLEKKNRCVRSTALKKTSLSCQVNRELKKSKSISSTEKRKHVDQALQRTSTTRTCISLTQKLDQKRELVRPTTLTKMKLVTSTEDRNRNRSGQQITKS